MLTYMNRAEAGADVAADGFYFHSGANDRNTSWGIGNRERIGTEWPRNEQEVIVMEWKRIKLAHRM